MNKRRMVYALVATVLIYMASYAILSSLGSYRSLINLRGVFMYYWVPKGFQNVYEEQNRFVACLYLPLYGLDLHTWHPNIMARDRDRLPSIPPFVQGDITILSPVTYVTRVREETPGGYRRIEIVDAVGKRFDIRLSPRLPDGTHPRRAPIFILPDGEMSNAVPVNDPAEFWRRLDYLEKGPEPQNRQVLSEPAPDGASSDKPSS